MKSGPGRLTAVGGDQKLEQSINLSSKCSDGVIGHAKQKQYVAQWDWDLIYREMKAVKNLHRQYANMMERKHHQWSQARTDHTESHVQAMMRYIEEKGTQLSVRASPMLQNFMTKEIMSDEIRKDMLNALIKGKEKYLTLKRENYPDH